MRIKVKKRHIGLIIFLSLLGVFILYNIFWLVYVQIRFIPFVNAISEKKVSSPEYAFSLLFKSNQANQGYGINRYFFHDEEKSLYYVVSLPLYLKFDCTVSLEYDVPNEAVLDLVVGDFLQDAAYTIELLQFKKPKYSFALKCITAVENTDGYIITHASQFTIDIDKDGNPLHSSNEKIIEAYNEKKDILFYLKELAYEKWNSVE